MITLASLFTPDMIWGTFIGLVIAFAIPMTLVAFGGMYSEHSGIVNIALEGIMVIGSMVAVAVARSLNDVVKNGSLPSWAAMIVVILAAGIGGSLFGLLLSFASNALKADQTIAGTALNIMAPAIFLIVSTAMNNGIETDWMSWPSWYKLSPDVFGVTERGFIRSLTTYTICNETTFFAIVLIPLFAFILYKTRYGLRLRSCGENPEASASLGINVLGLRYSSGLISGFLAGIGGCAFTLANTSDVYGDVAGLGFLSIAVMIFGNWNAVKIIFAALFFSFFKTLGNMTNILANSENSFLQALVSFPMASVVFAMLPYVVTLLVLIFTSKKSQAPNAEGKPFDVSRRS
ncbi:MAG: ABC transporter permease [Bacilli bacterium]